MGNPHQLTPARTAGRRTWRRSALYAAGTVAMLLVSMTASLALWIALPWAFLGWSPTLVTSGSMQPLVAPGDVVLVRPVLRADLAPNSVVLYQRPDTGRVLHRVLQELPDGTFRTGGDANASPDSAPVRLSEIRGAAVLSVPWIGRPSLWIYEGRVLPVAATAVLLLAALALAPRAFDPAFDPWSSGRRLSPAQVLLAEAAADGKRASRTVEDGRLLPGTLYAVVLDRLAAQTATAHRRTALLLDGLS